MEEIIIGVGVLVLHLRIEKHDQVEPYLKVTKEASNSSYILITV